LKHFRKPKPELRVGLDTLYWSDIHHLSEKSYPLNLELAEKASFRNSFFLSVEGRYNHTNKDAQNQNRAGKHEYYRENCVSIVSFVKRLNCAANLS